MHHGLLIFLACLTTTTSVVAGDQSSVADAAEQQDVKLVRKHIADGADVNAGQPDGMTALHWAVYHDDLPLTTLLIESNADVAARNRYDVAPLSIACTNGNTKIVSLLLEHSADANVARPGNETALMTAARTGRPEPVRLLLKHCAKVDATDWRGQTALMWAAAEGHEEVVKLLLKAGADPERRLKSGFTPLFFAVRQGQTAAVFALLEEGCDINTAMQPKSGGTKAPRKGMSPLILAVENGHFELASKLLDAGADPNDLRSGFSALHTLTWVRKPNRGDSADGDPSPIGSGSVTSLQLVEKLAAAGADVNIRLKGGRSGRGRLNQKGMTPFLMAADTADLALMKLLQKLGADPHIPNADNCTSLMAAAGIGSLAPGEEAGTEDEALAAVEYLLQQGSDINATDDNGETTMHGAAYKSLPRMVKYLAEHGADIDIWNRKNKYGWTPLQIAEGHRPGNFKPAPATIDAIKSVLDAATKSPTGT